ncbi:MAG: hypothetical protein MUE68_02345 [Bacteroidetes bacterium]|nr:hypothetical protein [Bacteroidota bacterium]
MLPEERLPPFDEDGEDDGDGDELRDGAGADGGGEYEGAGRAADSVRPDERSDEPDEPEDDDPPEDDEPDDRPKNSGNDQLRAGVEDLRSVEVRVRLALGAGRVDVVAEGLRPAVPGVVARTSVRPAELRPEDEPEDEPPPTLIERTPS